MAGAAVVQAHTDWTDGANPKNVSIDMAGCTVLLVKVAWRDQSRNITMTGLTYNGTALTQVGSLFRSSGPDNPGAAIDYWVLVNPLATGGAHTLAVTGSAGLQLGNDGGISAEGYSGIDTASPVRNDYTFEASSPFNAVSTTNVTVSGDYVTDCCHIASSAATGFAANAGQTEFAKFTASTVTYFGASGKAATTTSTATGWVYGPNDSYNAIYRSIVLKAGTADTTAPTLSGATGTATNTTTATGAVTTDEGNGTLYEVTTSSATAPTKAQVKSGLDNLGAGAYYVTSQSVSSSGTKNISATGLPQGTTLYHHFMHEDAAGNQSTVASSAAFKTFGIHDTDTDNAVNESQTSVVVTGKFGASTPVVRLKSGSLSQAQTVSGHDASTVTLTSITRGNLPYTDANHTHTIEVDSDQP